MIKIKLHLDVGESNGVMDLKITDHNSRTYHDNTLSQGKNIVELDVYTPNTLIFDLSGKNNRRDTVLDKRTGEIVRDKFIKMVGVEIDGKPLNEHRVAQMFTLKTETNEEIKSAFWGFNGRVYFDLPYEDALDLHLTNL